MKTIRVSGTGRASAPVDVVQLSMMVAGQEWDYEDAVNLLNTRVAALRQDLERAGVTPDALKSTNYSVTRDSNWDSEKSEQVFNGYRAAHTLHLQIDWELTVLNRILQEIAGGESLAEVNLNFSVRDQEGLRRAALADAVIQARERAEVLVAAAGVELGELQSIDHAWQEVRIGHEMIEYAMAPSESGPMADVAPDDLDTTETATLVWSLKT